MVIHLLIGVTYGFAAAVQPGPFQAYLISQTLTVGWRRTWPAAFAPLISDVPIALLALLVLSQVPGRMEEVLHIAGGMFVLYLAFGAYRAWKTFDADQPTRDVAKQHNVWRAATVNLLNPNAYIGWSLVMGPLLMRAWRETPAHGIALLAAFYGTMVLCGVGIVVLFGLARNLGPHVDRFMLGLSALALAGFGLYQLWMGIAPQL